MNLLEKHRDDYKKLKKKELYAIIEEQLSINRRKIDKNVYIPLLTIRNNNRRALRKFFPQRHTSIVAKAKVKEKLTILKDVRQKLSYN